MENIALRGFMMQLLTRANQNRLEKYLIYFAIVVSSALLINFLGWAIATSSFNLGFNLAKNLPRNWYEQCGGLSECSPGIYNVLSTEYTLYCGLSLLITLSCILQLLINSFRLICWLSFFNLVLLITIRVRLGWILDMKNPEQWEDGFNSVYKTLFRDSIPYDWICIYIITFLIAIELGSFILLKLRIKR
jgi:hypothetical protein